MGDDDVATTDERKPGAWTDEQIRKCWLDEVNARFAAENASWRAMEQRDLDKIAAAGEIHRLPPNMLQPRDSFLCEIWNESVVTLYLNVAEVLLADHSVISTEVIAMLDHTECGWGRAGIHAIVVDGKPRLQVSVMLVDSWDDERSAAWKATHPTWSADVRKIVDWDRDDDNADANAPAKH